MAKPDSWADMWGCQSWDAAALITLYQVARSTPRGTVWHHTFLWNRLPGLCIRYFEWLNPADELCEPHEFPGLTYYNTGHVKFLRTISDIERATAAESHSMKNSFRWPVALITLIAVVGIAGYAQGWFVPTETKVTELAPGVYFRKCQTEPEFLGCNQGWVVFKDFVLVIDANFPDQAEELIKEVRKTTDKPIRYVFDTHYHGDHADGNQKYTAIGATAIANENSRELFDTKGNAGFEQSRKTKPNVYEKLDYAKPSLYFPQKLVVDDGTQRVELLHFGHAHTAGDAFAWLPKHGILFSGDACVNGAFNYTGDSDTGSWIGVMTSAQRLPVKQVAPGHGELADGTLLAMQKRYFVELREAVQKGIDSGKTLDAIKNDIKLPFYKEWTGVDVKTRTENIEHVFGELTGKKKPGGKT